MRWHWAVGRAKLFVLACPTYRLVGLSVLAKTWWVEACWSHRFVKTGRSWTVLEKLHWGEERIATNATWRSVSLANCGIFLMYLLPCKQKSTVFWETGWQVGGNLVCELKLAVRRQKFSAAIKAWTAGGNIPSLPPIPGAFRMLLSGKSPSVES